MTKSTEQALGEIVRRKSKREALYHIRIREIVNAYHCAPNGRSGPIYCELCACWISIIDYSDQTLVIEDHADDCPVKLAEVAIGTDDANEIARLLDEWAQGRGA